jgi:hypothetical protein
MYFIFFGGTLTSNNIIYGVMSYNISFIFDNQIICKAVKYVDQSNSRPSRVLGLILRKLVGSIRINLNLTLYGMSLDDKKGYNKHVILILLFLFQTEPSWPWSYGSWIYNYLCNQYLSPLMLWVRISIRARCTTLCDKVCQWLAIGQWFSPGPRFHPPIKLTATI